MSRGLILTAFILVIALITVSAYIRLSHAGLGCEDWPACYGRIGSAEKNILPATDRLSSYERLITGPQEPLAWATPAHRLIASILGVLVFAINIQAFICRKKSASMLMPLMLLSLTVFLAILGLTSGGLHRPSIVISNLIGGFSMLAILWWLHLSTKPASSVTSIKRHLQPWIVLGIAILIIQIILGGLTSANFAALACTTFPDCHNAWLPTAALNKALSIFRVIDINTAGVVVLGPEQQAIHITHRLGAWILLIYLGTLAIKVSVASKEYRFIGVMLLVLLLIEILVGSFIVLMHLPLSVTLAHNSIAAALLLCLLSLHKKVTH